HRGRAAVGALADGAAPRGHGAAHRARLRSRGSGPARLSARQPPRDQACRLRLFVALNFPPQVRQALWQATAPLRGRGPAAHWVRAEGIHLTLKFLGEVDEERDGELRAALTRAAAGARALTMQLGGFRSEERRVGKECRARGWPYHYKKKNGVGEAASLERLRGD